QPLPQQPLPQKPSQNANVPQLSTGRHAGALPPSSLPYMDKRDVNNRATEDSGTMHDSSYDSNAEDEEDFLSSHMTGQDFRFKFGTDMPSTIDLKSAIESCDALCNFALHYAGHANAVHDDGRESLDPDMRANLQIIRSMNTTMLIGLQNVPRRGERSTMDGIATDIADDDEGESNTAPPDRAEEHSPLRFGYGPPPHELVHELAKVATSLFQLAIRIKAWVGMSPEQRELDEDLNRIRGKRCLLMESTLAVSKVDRNGNLKKDWAVVPAVSGMSRTFYERQREMDQRRPSQGQPHNSKHGQHQQLPQSQQAQLRENSSDQPGGESDLSKKKTNNERPIYRRVNSSSTLMSLSTSHPGYGVNGATSSSSFSSDSNMSKAYHDMHTMNSHSKGSDGGDGGNNTDKSRNSKNSEPYQKYKKRAKRSHPPGRCLSCQSSDTPEWRRGPDGARTLCNACGLHYAKLMKRQNGQGSLSIGPPPVIKSRASAMRIEQFQQAITFPPRKQDGSLSPAVSAQNGSESKELSSGAESLASGSSGSGSSLDQSKNQTESPSTTPGGNTPDSQDLSSRYPTVAPQPATAPLPALSPSQGDSAGAMTLEMKTITTLAVGEEG
ncbi:hypothetical protein BGZ98_006708, partial [Dissophora globulifera]